MHDSERPVEGPGPSTAVGTLSPLTPEEARMDTGLAVSLGGLLYRRTASPRLELASRDPHRFIVATRWHEFSGDLSKGILLQAIRKRDGGASAPICHSGNVFGFRGGTLDVEAHIVDYGLRRLPGQVRLFHESRFTRRGLLGRQVPFARLRYDYTIQVDSPVLHLTATLTAEPGATIWFPVLTSGLDALSAPAPVRRAVVWGDTTRTVVAAEEGRNTLRLHAGPAHHLALSEEIEGGATCHVRLLDGAKLETIVATPEQRSALHWVLLRYRGPTLRGGLSMVVREERLRLPYGALDPTDQSAGSLLGAEIGEVWPVREKAATAPLSGEKPAAARYPR